MSRASSTAETARRLTMWRAAVAVVLLLGCTAASYPGRAEPVGNPHWDSSACQACHEHPNPDPAHLGLRTAEPDALCADCHGEGYDGGSCRHASGISPGAMPVPDSLRVALVADRITCTTCHDLAVQCTAPGQSYRYMNPGFLRDRKSLDTASECFRCHDPRGFEKLNPHENAGDRSCLLCHATQPSRGADGHWLAVDFNMQHDLNDTCRGCHPVRPHPANAFSGVEPGWDHLAVPSDKVVAKMRATEAATGAVLPLEPETGKVHCATCHEPHEDGLNIHPAVAGPGTAHRLRLEHMCQACHEK